MYGEESEIKNYYYIDKTPFIKEWWESGDSVTLITRPRRFGKTLNMSMLEQFFSVEYGGREDLFKGLKIWEDENYRKIQGTYPVINLSFANIKERSYEATLALHRLSDYLCRYYGEKVIILLDEYDTPMQEAYVNGYWDEMVTFIRSLFNSTFKTNPYMERGMMTGITRVSSISLCELPESVFSDLNNLKVVTTTSNEYATAFGFTEEEVFAALYDCNLGEEKEKVKYWYNGFSFGKHTDIYNPWSVLNFLDTGVYDTYWANTSSNSKFSGI